jgi:DNA invertase Pin-like site-specific DNA recombinase
MPVSAPTSSTPRTNCWSCGATSLRVAGRQVWSSLDEGVSGAKTRRPALDRLILVARRRQIDAVVCWRLDRLGGDLAHLLAMANEWTTLGVAFISLGKGIDATTPAGGLARR